MLDANMIEEIFTKVSQDAADSSNIVVIPASTGRRPFVIYSTMTASAGTMELKMGVTDSEHIYKTNSDTTEQQMILVGNKGDRVIITTDATIGTKQYVVTGGYLSKSAGNPQSGDLSA